MTDLESIRNFLAGEGILMCFNGPFRHSIIEELGNAVRKHLESEAVRKSELADVFTVFIEAAQNVANYAQRPHLDLATRQRVLAGVLVIGRRGEHHVVRCGNFIAETDRTDLQDRLDGLASMDAAALKAHYKERLRTPVGPGELGAGLGLIRIARTASEPLRYSIKPGQDGLPFFSLEVVL